MSLKAGQLLWNRARITLPPGLTTFDTGLTQTNLAFENSSAGEPPLGVSAAPPGPGPGTLPASRVQVVPMSPVPSWLFVAHGEPFVNPATGTVNVLFSNTTSPPVSVEVNVLFWDPHTGVGPGQAMTYQAAP